MRRSSGWSSLWGGSPESQNGKGSERALEERMASPWRNTGVVVLPRQEAASESAPDGKYYHRCMHLEVQYPIFSWEYGVT